MDNRKASVQTRQEVEKFVVRLPKGIRGMISEISRINHRSMNSEIVARLEESLGLSAPVDGVSEAPPELYAVNGDHPRPDMQLTDEQTAAQQEERLLERFRRLSGDRRRALLELLR
ncbi:putative transcriptional regulator [Alcanivorax sp. S71-1-4]|jgi:hypothetical protein|uniref:Arc family DNA-binding protein n=1 Tax=Alcanivorax sp. S71-1-4 TaxID=1177159 RepID=UPI001358D23F|nr:Arc family DNA-binding protein [Alcanivorax sp. S71-1-4]KAF0810694.1 putative transcriptional regulator [Alcanivorax sp. S71-1-4]